MRSQALAAWLVSGVATAAPPLAGQNFALDLPRLNMVWMAPGEFLLGSPDSETSRGSDEGPLTRVNITRGFWIGQTEVTQAQWRAVMGTDPSRFKGDARPVEQVSWFDAMEFGRRLSESERVAGRLPVGYAFTLPTESQWEYAAKAGMVGAFSQAVDDLAWHDQNTQQTQNVASKKPNAWGLFDTLGNVWEWCYDWYAPYPGGAVQDYAGPPISSSKASRGGSWWAGPRGARPANRYRDMPHNGNDDLGFRIGLTPLLPGTVSLAGTDSMAPLVQSWIAAFSARHRQVNFQFETGSPPSAAAGLAAGSATIGYTGRTLWAPEVAAIVNARGQPPRTIRIAGGSYNDARKTHPMAVFVQAENPLRGLTLAQLQQVFGGSGQGMTWGQLGLGGEWENQPVRTMVAKLGTGATIAAKDAALAGNDWAKSVKEFADDQSAVAAVAADRAAIGIAGLPYAMAGVRALALGASAVGGYYEPTHEHVATRRYPLARLLYFHIIDSRTQPLAASTRDFIRFVLSEEGQGLVEASGYLPLTPDIAREELAALPQ